MLSKIRRRLRRWSGRFRSRHRIFLLSHMRAYTSLLGHILGSNPQIEGYYELHEGYLRPSDLIKTKKKYYRFHCPKDSAAYLFDKLLHNHYRLSEDLVGKEDKLILMIREPEATINSILKIFSDKPKSQWANQASAERYYIERLQELVLLSGVFEGRYFFLKSEDLLSDTEETLDALSRFLELPVPLSDHYETFVKTGRRGFGDSSTYIVSGKIVKVKSGEDKRIEAAPPCHEAYRHALSILVERAYKP